LTIEEKEEQEEVINEVDKPTLDTITMMMTELLIEEDLIKEKKEGKIEERGDHNEDTEEIAINKSDHNIDAILKYKFSN